MDCLIGETDRGPFPNSPGTSHHDRHWPIGGSRGYGYHSPLVFTERTTVASIFESDPYAIPRLVNTSVHTIGDDPLGTRGVGRLVLGTVGSPLCS